MACLEGRVALVHDELGRRPDHHRGGVDDVAQDPALAVPEAVDIFAPAPVDQVGGLGLVGSAHVVPAGCRSVARERSTSWSPRAVKMFAGCRAAVLQDAPGLPDRMVAFLVGQGCSIPGTRPVDGHELAPVQAVVGAALGGDHGHGRTGGDAAQDVLQGVLDAQEQLHGVVGREVQALAVGGRVLQKLARPRCNPPRRCRHAGRRRYGRRRPRLAIQQATSSMWSLQSLLLG